MVDALAVFIVDRLVVLVAAGDVVADPDFRIAAFGFDQADGFTHQAVQRKAGQNGCGRSDLFFDAFAIKHCVRVGDVVVDGNVGKIVDVLFAGVAPDEVLGASTDTRREENTSLVFRWEL